MGGQPCGALQTNDARFSFFSSPPTEKNLLPHPRLLLSLCPFASLHLRPRSRVRGPIVVSQTDPSRCWRRPRRRLIR